MNDPNVVASINVLLWIVATVATIAALYQGFKNRNFDRVAWFFFLGLILAVPTESVLLFAAVSLVATYHSVNEYHQRKLAEVIKASQQLLRSEPPGYVASDLDGLTQVGKDELKELRLVVREVRPIARKAA